MIDIPYFLLSLLVTAGVTYLVRMLPLVLVKRKITNRFIRSFLYYIPYSVLGVMTIPSVFSSTSYLISAVCGFAAAVTAAYFERSLLTVAALACAAVFVCELVIMLI